MKTIILHGEQCTAQIVYMLVDELLHQHQVRDVVLAQTIEIDYPAAHALRDGGGELWFCAPDRQHARLGTPDSDRYLLANTVEQLAGLTTAAFGEFMGKTRVAA